jgi:hypothetical protein
MLIFMSGESREGEGYRTKSYGFCGRIGLGLMGLMRVIVLAEAISEASPNGLPLLPEE